MTKHDMPYHALLLLSCQEKGKNEKKRSEYSKFVFTEHAIETDMTLQKHSFNQDSIF